MLTMISPTEYTVALCEFCPVTIMRAKKLVKKITRQPCLQDTVRLTAVFVVIENVNIN